MRSPRTYLIGTSIALFIVVLVGYSLFESRNLILGPQVTIETPQNGEAFDNAPVTVAGNAQNITHIILNDRPIFIDEEGNFTEQLLLPEGYTIMTVTAEDRFGRETTHTLHLVRN